MPQWLHDRAKHILAKNKNMPESEAFAIATQQSHALGKSPKSYGTVRGREEAKAKYKTPEDDQKTAARKVRESDAYGEGAKFLAAHPGLAGLEGAVAGGTGGAAAAMLANKNPLFGALLGAGLMGPLSYHHARAVNADLRKTAMSLDVVRAFKRELQKLAWHEEMPGGLPDRDRPGEFPQITVQEEQERLRKIEKKAELWKLAKEEFKLQGHTEHQGIPIAIENRKGSVRKGVDKDGKPWRTVMKVPYGYIKGSKGADGEEVDAYVGPHEEATHAYVVHQRKSDGKGYDEDKVMLGFPSKEEAVKGYLKHYNSDKFLGPVKEVPVDRLKEMLQMKKKLVKISGLACADELLKLGAITDEQAQRALDRYETLDKQRPTLKQVGRYAALGAAAGPAAHVIGNLGRGKGLKGAIDVSKDVAGKAMSHGKLRTLAGTASAGAVTTGVVPFARLHLDRSAERKTLRQYVGQAKEKDSAMSGITPAKAWAANESADLGKYGFAMSQYSSGQGSPRFKQESAVPPFRLPSLRSPVPEPTAGIVEKLGASATPQGNRASAQRVGLPRVTNVAGPSIASQVGHAGRVLPGAGKGGIGKGGVSIGSSSSVM